MDGIGPEDILKSTCWSANICFLVKKFPHNVGSLRMVTEALIRPVLGTRELQTMADLTAYL